MSSEDIKDEVRKRYDAIAQSGGSCCESSCCGEAVHLAPPKTDALIASADLGLGCGLPTEATPIQPGETVLDLGSGAGVDVLAAAKKVGAQGQVIGVDFAPEMVARARQIAEQGGFSNVEFRLGDLEALPVDDESVDVVLSNCVINLVPDKRRVFAEVYRVLKPGGRFSIADIVTQGEVPPHVRQDVSLWASCLGGALDLQEYLQIIHQTGFTQVRIQRLSAYEMPEGGDFGFYSLTVVGHKPPKEDESPEMSASALR
jgi:SAM-dependent methyltransferase